MKLIKIADDFSDVPLGRYRTDSAVSGERFREEFLRPALEQESKVCVDIDGVEGYGSSFLDESFGGLVRGGVATAAVLHQKLEIQNADPDYRIYRDLIWKYIDDAKVPKKR